MTGGIHGRRVIITGLDRLEDGERHRVERMGIAALAIENHATVRPLAHQKTLRTMRKAFGDRAHLTMPLLIR